MSSQSMASNVSASSLAKHGLGKKGRGVSPSSQQFVRWMRLEALPFWMKRGWDAKNGGFHERFFFDGASDDLVLRRTRVQWRQIYVLSHASMLGWTQGLKLAFQGLEHLLLKAWAPDGRPGFVELLASDGSVAEKRRTTYDHMFALLALSWLAKASGDAQVRALVDMVLGFVDEHLSDDEGMLLEGVPHVLPRRQNPHMHAFEAMLSLMETIAHPAASLRAARYRKLLETRFIDPTTNLLIENFDAQWQPVLQDGASVVEPGHMAEWAWLVRKHERLAKQPNSPLATHLLGAALQASEPNHGFLIDEIDTNQQVRKASRRLWPQTELIKAWLAQAEIGADRADESAEAAIDAVMAHYLRGPFDGGWYDQFDAQGRIATDTVPASTLYHLFVAAAEADRLLGS